MIVLFRGSIGAALLTLLALAPASAQQRFAYVDSRKVLQEMPGRTQAEAQLRAGLEALGVRQRTMVDSLNAMMGAFERDSATLTQPERVARFNVLQMYDGRYRDTLAALEAEAEQQQVAAMQPLFDLIRVALEDLRQSEGYTMIFDIGSQTNQIVAMDRNLDVSDRLLAKIRAMPAAQRPIAPPIAAPTTPATPQRPPGPVSQPTGVTRRP
ncbi:MAG: OmpH family outer membrane protein [Gemmatimonadaceae bacterium]